MNDVASIAFVTDSTSDVPPEEAQSLGIIVIPALLTLDGQTYRDGFDLSREEFYARLPTLQTFPTTAVPSPQAFEEAYERCIQNGSHKIISVHLSKKLSGMYSVACTAAQKFPNRVEVFDSGMVTLGLGFQVMEAAAAHLAGASFEEIMGRLRVVRTKARVLAMLDTQEYLRRSGRVSWARAGLGKMLRIRLLVEVVDGVVERRGLIRTRSKAIEALVESARAWAPFQRLAVLHTAAASEAESISERLSSLTSLKPLIVEVTTLLGAHVGPAALGVAALRT